ncbi:hypothetical protein D9613_004830 [Agrocybe pediades]|uniref:Ras-GAP domain-containing protein n=1 Tax=Agrocybe pediades TaxID=84607 RepID=A0A8H4VU54_9AGAR|nr:hypothetical protein D9613_004830 [Agrocybe pediades]
MPRRPSASVGASSTPITSNIVVHRTTESHHVFTSVGVPHTTQPSLHTAYSANSSHTSQHKMIQVLVQRLRQKLPSTSGLSLDRVEADPSTQRAIEALVELSKDWLDVMIWELCELLEGTAKHESVPIDALQSRLFILKVLAVCMASRWSHSLANDIPPPSSPDSPYPSDRQAPSEYSTYAYPGRPPPPIKDACAKYVLSVMVLLVRYSTNGDEEVPLMLQLRSTDLSFRDFDDNIDLSAPPDRQTLENPPLRSRTSLNSVRSTGSAMHMTTATSTIYEKTHMSLLRYESCVHHLIKKFIGRIIFHISSSNWTVVYERLFAKLNNLTADAPTDMSDLYLLSHSRMDKQRLALLLHHLSSLLIEMKEETQCAVAVHLRTAIWNWIDIFPEEYNDVVTNRGWTDTGPERAFDALYPVASRTDKEGMYWPTLIILHCLTADRITAGLNYSATGRKELPFSQNVLRNVYAHNKLSDAALVCAVDVCRASMYINCSGEVPLRTLASDFVHEMKSALYKCGPTRRPFWESYEDIDIALYADALVAIFRLLPLEESLPLFQECVEPERSDAVKTVVARACLTLVQEASIFPWQKPFDGLQIAISGRFRDILKHVGTQRQNEVEYSGTMKRVASRPKGKRTLPEPLSEREVLILSILSLWREDLGFFMKIINKENIDNWLTVIDKLWVAPIDTSVKVSTARCMTKITEQSISTTPVDNNEYRMIDIVKAALPVTLITVSHNLLAIRDDADSERLCISVAHQVMEFYAMNSDLEYIQFLQIDPNRIPALALAEIAFLVELTSADNDISHLAAKGLRLIAHAERQENAPVNACITEEDRSKRNPIYEQLGDPGITIAGRLGHQKRIRKLVRMLRFSAGTQLVVWEECYWRWRILNEAINNALNEAAADLEPLSPKVSNHFQQQQQQPTQPQEDIRNQWQNLTLFLAALGGSCLEQKVNSKELTNVITPYSVPDKVRVPQNPVPLIEDFIADLIQLLIAGDIKIRDIVRDALGSELSPRLYLKLVSKLDKTIDVLRNTQEPASRYLPVLDQIVSLLKLIADNTEATLEDLKNIDLTPTMSKLAKFLSRSSDEPFERAKIKLKYCLLCESVCDRVDTLALRRDNVVRHEILSFILQWMVTKKGSNEERSGISSDLKMACLRATVKLLDRLPLNTLETSSQGDESTHVVSRQFNKYSAALLSCIGYNPSETNATDTFSDKASSQQKTRASQKEAQFRELVITGLAHLVSANSKNGFKQCVSLAYDPDNRKRAIFAHVFSRVIGQGTVFNQPVENKKPLQSALCDLVRSSDSILAMTICEVCPPSEVDMMISVLMNIYDTRPALMKLLKAMIEREVAHTDNKTALFRSNSTFTRFLSAFARLHGHSYLRGLVQPLLNVMLTLPPGSGFEIDELKARREDIEQNKINVKYVASQFLTLVSSSMSTLPGMFREVCSYISQTVGEVWPDARYAAIGAFIFLRFISPAIVGPEAIDIQIPKGEHAVTIRRGLLTMAKILQNLANNIFFGKEPHMAPLNDFLRENVGPLTRFLQSLQVYTAPEKDEDPWDGITSDDTDAVVLHRFFQKHADKIGKELLSLSRPSPNGETAGIIGKRSWDTLCALLVDLGPPMEPPQLSDASSADHYEYLDLVNKYANKSTSSVEHLFLETDIQDSTAVFVLRLSQIDVENLDIELFMYHILKTLSSPTYESRKYDIILDCTGFASPSEVPLQWLKYCAEVVPEDIRSRFVVTRILSPNLLTQKYLRRLYNVAAGAPFCQEIKMYTSVMELLEDVRSKALPALSYPVSLEQEPFEEFTGITMTQPAWFPVTLRVGRTHIRVTSVKAMPVSPGISCKSTELILVSDLTDCYNISTATEQDQFIIRLRNGQTFYFKTVAREPAVKAIRTAKATLKDVPTPLAESFTVFSNVAATLLHIGFFSVDLDDEELRTAAYDLLGAVCKYLKYDQSPLISCKSGFVSGDPVTFVYNLSEKLSTFAPDLTLDFIHEYLSPWIKNISLFGNPTHDLYEKSGVRQRDCIRTLTDISLKFPDITSSMHQYIWSEVGKLDSHVVDTVVEMLLRTGVDSGIGSQRCETVCLIVAAMSSINVRGKLYARLRKTFIRMPLQKHTHELTAHPHWNELATLIRLVFITGTQSTHHGTSYMFVPEVLHLVCLTAGVGPVLIRKSVYGTTVNLLQTLYAARQDDSTEPGLAQLISESTSPEISALFGLKRETASGEYFIVDYSNERAQLEVGEQLVHFVMRIMETSAGTPGLLNSWKARWMSLVTSTAFQQTPSVQTRSCLALANLFPADVDDDYLYQIMVAFKMALEMATEGNTATTVSMLRCMWKMVPRRTMSRYAGLLFWLAVALLQASQIAHYVDATSLLCVTLENLDQHGHFEDQSVNDGLLIFRGPLEEWAGQLDDMLRISFERNFSFSLAAVIFKGMRHSGLKSSAENTLRTLLRVASAAERRLNTTSNGARKTLSPEVLGYFLALLPVSTTPESYRRLLEESDLEPGVDDFSSELDTLGRSVPRLDLETLGINDQDTALLVASFVGTIAHSAQGDDAESQILFDLLASIALSFPHIISITYESLQERIKDIFASSSNPSVVRSICVITRVALQDPVRSGNYSSRQASASTLDTIDESPVGPGRMHLIALEELGMQGLANGFQFLPKGYSTRVVNWIPQLVSIMLDPEFC